MVILIDPPVTPFHPVEEIEAWVRELHRLKARDDNPNHTAVYDEEIARAQRWVDEHPERVDSGSA